MDYKTHFIAETIKEYPSTELAALLRSQSDCGFYELCQKFVDVGLNSYKHKTENFEIAAVFDYGDMDAARTAAISFISDNRITDVVSFLKILNKRYPLATDPSDPRQKIAGYMDESYQFGRLFSFSRLPEEVFQKIIEGIE